MSDVGLVSVKEAFENSKDRDKIEAMDRELKAIECIHEHFRKDLAYE